MGYSISEVSSRSGFSVDTLRYYEKIRLIDAPARDRGGRRVYSDADLKWLDFLARLRAVEMPVRFMVDYAALQRQGDATIPERAELLKELRAVAGRRIKELRACERALDRKIAEYERD